MSRLIAADSAIFPSTQLFMTAFKNAQQHLLYNGRHFHFVSYDAQPGNVKRGIAEVGPMWYLMGPNKRWPVMPHTPDQSDEEVVTELKTWITGQGLDR